MAVVVNALELLDLLTYACHTLEELVLTNLFYTAQFIYFIGLIYTKNQYCSIDLKIR